MYLRSRGRNGACAGGGEAADLLVGVHRLVGAAEEFVGEVAGPAEGEADADAAVDGACGGGVGGVGGADDPVGDLVEQGRVGHALEEDGELVAADARDQVLGAYGGGQAGGGAGEDLVADAVAVAVVDLLEVVRSTRSSAGACGAREESASAASRRSESR